MLNSNFKVTLDSKPLAYLLAFTVYSTELFKHFIFTSYFAIDIYLISLSVLGILFFKMNKKLFILISGIILILFFSSLLLFLYNFHFENFTRQGIGIFLVYLGLGSLVLRADKSELIKAYMLISLFVAIFGLIQWAFSYLGIADIIIKETGQLDSITYEPSHYAIAASPALFLFIRSFLINISLQKLITMLVMILSFLLTFSLTAYVMLFLIIFYIIIARKKLILFFSCFLFLVIIFGNFFKFSNLNSFKKLSTIEKKISSFYKNIENLRRINTMEYPKNLTIFSLLINLNAAKVTLYSGRIFGNGFGSQSQVIEESVPMKFQKTYYFKSQIYNSNGFSLFIRVISEFGIIGFILFIFFIIKGIFRNQLSIIVYDIWWLLGSIHMISLILKTTSFIDYGTPIFLLVPLLIKKEIFLNEKDNAVIHN